MGKNQVASILSEGFTKDELSEIISFYLKHERKFDRKRNMKEILIKVIDQKQHRNYREQLENLDKKCKLNIHDPEFVECMEKDNKLREEWKALESYRELITLQECSERIKDKD